MNFKTIKELNSSKSLLFLSYFIISEFSVPVILIYLKFLYSFYNSMVLILLLKLPKNV